MISVYLFEPDPELHSGTERSSFSDKFRRPGPEPWPGPARLCFLSIAALISFEIPSLFSHCDKTPFFS